MHASKFTKFKFIVRDARVFPGIWFDFIYPHNSSLFFATPFGVHLLPDYHQGWSLIRDLTVHILVSLQNIVN